MKREIKIPPYSRSEELCNAITHGLGAVLSIAALVLMLVRARGALAVTAAALFGSSMILLYTISCLYHALSPGSSGKKVLRVLDHCTVFLLVFGTYIPASLLGGSRTAVLGAFRDGGFFHPAWHRVHRCRSRALSVRCGSLSALERLVDSAGDFRSFADRRGPGPALDDCRRGHVYHRGCTLRCRQA